VHPVPLVFAAEIRDAVRGTRCAVRCVDRGRSRKDFSERNVVALDRPSVYTPYGTTGAANCVAYFGGKYQRHRCTGTYGYALVYDFGTAGKSDQLQPQLLRSGFLDAGKGPRSTTHPPSRRNICRPIPPPARIAPHPINLRRGRQDCSSRRRLPGIPSGMAKMKILASYGVFNDA